MESLDFNATKSRFYVGGKLPELKMATDVPGPGGYDLPSPDKVKKGSPSFTLKGRIDAGSMGSSKSKVVGPGQYTMNFSDKPAGPRFGFGTSARQGMAKKDEAQPGPGAYRVPSSIGDVPAYAMPSRKDEYKFI